MNNKTITMKALPNNLKPATHFLQQRRYGIDAMQSRILNMDIFERILDMNDSAGITTIAIFKIRLK